MIIPNKSATCFKQSWMLKYWMWTQQEDRKHELSFIFSVSRIHCCIILSKNFMTNCSCQTVHASGSVYTPKASILLFIFLVYIWSGFFFFTFHIANNWLSNMDYPQICYHKNSRNGWKARSVNSGETATSLLYLNC